MHRIVCTNGSVLIDLDQLDPDHVPSVLRRLLYMDKDFQHPPLKKDALGFKIIQWHEELQTSTYVLGSWLSFIRTGEINCDPFLKHEVNRLGGDIYMDYYFESVYNPMTPEEDTKRLRNTSAFRSLLIKMRV